MKTSSSRSAFFTVRSIAALLLCIAGSLFALFAVSAGMHGSSGKTAQKIRRGGGGAPLNNSPAEPGQAGGQSNVNVPYNGPQNDFRPVAAVRSGELRQTKPVHPSK